MSTHAMTVERVYLEGVAKSDLSGYHGEGRPQSNCRGAYSSSGSSSGGGGGGRFILSLFELFDASAEEDVARPERFYVLTGKRVRR